MIISESLKVEIENSFIEVEKRCKNRAKQLFLVLDTCTEEEKICMKFLYVNMPAADLANHDGELFLKFVKHSLKMRDLVPWGKDVNGNTFLNYVLQYRINNENVDFYSEIISNELLEIVKDMTMKQAVLAVNYWCFSKATYQATDFRTLSAIGIMTRSFGRCGEESTFAVSALRSIGIPARQIYSPRWAHCDNNHAWVEILIDGEWHFIGACEPENELDRGWFTLHASRAMLLNTRVLSGHTDNEEFVTKSKTHTEVNVLSNYATAKYLTITVKDEKGNPVEEAGVRFEIINYSQLFPIANLKTDKDGKVKILTGLGDVVVYVYKEDKFTYRKVDVRLEDSADFVLSDKGDYPTTFTIIPPAGQEPKEGGGDDDKTENEKALKKRQAYEETFYTGEKATKFAEKYGKNSEKVAKFLENARGNHAEIIEFISDMDMIDYKVAMLGTLKDKDFVDITADILKGHFKHSMQFKDAGYDNDIFVNYILAPRIMFEMLISERAEIAQRFTAEQIEGFKNNPKTIIDYMGVELTDAHMPNKSTYFASTVGMLDLGFGDSISQKIAFIAICRAIGVPAKFNRENHSMSYFKDGSWVTLNEAKAVTTGKMVLKSKDDTKLEYMVNVTVARLAKTYNTVQYELNSDNCELEVEVGDYRIMTSNRNANGDVILNMYYTKIEEGKTVEVEVEVPKYENVIDKTTNLKNHTVTTTDNKKVELFDLLKNDSKYMVAYIDVSKEPTEHLLNEIASKYSPEEEVNLIVIVRKPEDVNDPTLQRALKTKLQVYIGYEREAVQYIYDDMEMKDANLPIVTVVDTNKVITNAWAGYNVGIADAVQKCIDN